VPKIVDHAERREQIARALWRVLRRDGIRSVSVRTVAAEAGWSAGSLRYYFPDQAELLYFAMQLVTDRVTARIGDLPATTDPVARSVAILEQVIPLDADRRAEFEVWLTFVSQARLSPRLQERLEEAHESLHGLCRTVLDGLVQLGAARPDLALATETERLHALVDGLSLHAATVPDQATPRRVRAAVRTHLRDLGPSPR
jgi:AcrR family transcriptional regulator